MYFCRLCVPLQSKKKPLGKFMYTKKTISILGRQFAGAKRKYPLICLLFFCSFSFAQIPHIVPSPVSIAHTSVADAGAWTAFNNPAALGYVERISASTTFENRYLLKELSTRSIQAGFATEHINIGGSFSYFGYSLYHEMLIGIDFARNFSDKFALGVGFDYYTAYFSADGRYHGALLGRVGATIRLSPDFMLGFSTFNPFQNNIQTDFITKRIPSVFSLGTSYNFSSDFVWRTQIDKELSSNYRFATGFEYRMQNFINVKIGGYFLQHFVPCIGFGLFFGDYSADINCEIHPILGVTTMISLRYNF